MAIGHNFRKMNAKAENSFKILLKFYTKTHILYFEIKFDYVKDQNTKLLENLQEKQIERKIAA